MSSDALKIAVSGMRDATLRISTAANNIANARTTGAVPSASDGSDSSVYKAQTVVSSSQEAGTSALGVSSHVTARKPSYQLEADPQSPYANAGGLVAAPNVDLTQEVVDTKMAAAAYQASASIVRVVDENEKSLMKALSS